MADGLTAAIVAVGSELLTPHKADTNSLYITEVLNMEQDTIIMQDIFRFIVDGVDENGKAIGHFEATGVRTAFMNRLEAAGVRLPANLFAARRLGYPRPC